MVAPSPQPERRWFERTVIAAMVIAGFAVGSIGLTVAAELLGEDPVLTDEFNAPVAADDPTGIVAVAATTTQPSTTQPFTTTPPATTSPPASSSGESRSSADPADSADSAGGTTTGSEAGGDRGDPEGRDDDQRRDRSGRDDRDARRRA